MPSKKKFFFIWETLKALQLCCHWSIASSMPRRPPADGIRKNSCWTCLARLPYAKMNCEYRCSGALVHVLPVAVAPRNGSVPFSYGTVVSQSRTLARVGVPCPFRSYPPRAPAPGCDATCPCWVLPTWPRALRRLHVLARPSGPSGYRLGPHNLLRLCLDGGRRRCEKSHRTL